MKHRSTSAHGSTMLRLGAFFGYSKPITKVLSAATSLLLVASAAVLGVTAPASAHTPDASATCETLSVSLTAYKNMVPAKGAEYATTYQRYSWTGNAGGSDPSISSPISEPGNWQVDNKKKPGSDPIDQPFQQGYGQNASWFYWVSGQSEVSPATPAKVNTVTVFVNGVQVDSQEFGATFTKDYPFADKTAANTWEVVIDAWDGTDWDTTLSGTSTACVPVDACPGDWSKPGDKSWEIHWGQNIDTRNDPALWSPSDFGGLVSIVGIDENTANGDNIYVHAPADFGLTNTYTFADGTVIVAAVAQATPCPSVTWSLVSPQVDKAAIPIQPTAVAGTEVCTSGVSQDAPGTITLPSYVGGHWAEGSGTLTGVAPGEYAFTAVADSGYTIQGDPTYFVTVPKSVDVVCGICAAGTTGNISADGTDVWWEIKFGHDAATQNDAPTFGIDSYGGFDHAVGYDDNVAKHMKTGVQNIYVHMPANSVAGNNTETWFFKDGTTVVFTVSGDLCNPTMTWEYNLPKSTHAVSPTLKVGTEMCVAGQSQDANGSVALEPFTGGHWELGGVTVSGTVSDLAPGSYAFKAIADTGYMMAGKWWFTVVVPQSTDVDCIVPLPDKPVWTDLCGVDNGAWTVPADGNGIAWSVVDHTTLNGKVGIVATVTTPGMTFPSGATFKQWTAVQDNTLCDTGGGYTITFLAPGAVDPTCEATDQQGEFAGGNIATSGYIKLDLKDHLHYSIDGVPTSSANNDVAPGEHTISVMVDDGFTLVGPKSWTLMVNEAFCDLPTHALLSTSASMSNITCAASGSYTLADTAGVQWFVNGSTTPTAAGTYQVSGASTVNAEARLIDTVNDGWDFDAQTAWAFEFTDPADCLATLAFTGTDSALVGGLLSSGFLVAGGVLLVLRSRMRRAAH